MNFGAQVPDGALHDSKRVKYEGGLRPRRAPAINFYTTPPDEDISLDDFQDLAVERLRVMTKVEAMRTRGGLTGSEMTDKLMEFITNSDVPGGVPTHLTCDDPESVKADNASHWIMRLAFCGKEDLRRRFLDFEVFLFRCRYESLTKVDRESFLASSGLGFRPIDGKELDDNMSDFRVVYASGATAQTMRRFDDLAFFKVHFTEVLDLVRARRVFVKGGYAYVPSSDLISILTSRFRSQLSAKLTLASKSLSIIKEDDRIRPILAKFHSAYLGTNYASGATSGDVRLENLNVLSKRSYPLCMGSCHSDITRHHKLKHQGRLQFQLFLKGIGLSMEDCLAFFQQEFTKGPNMDAEKFRKDYAYGIRHAYGKEGKRADYTPYACSKIISTPAGELYAGCPFKTFAKNPKLREMLASNPSLTRRDVDEIFAKASDGHAQIACRNHFAATHRVPQEVSLSAEDRKTIADLEHDVGNHPNAWFQASEKHFAALTLEGEERLE